MSFFTTQAPQLMGIIEGCCCSTCGSITAPLYHLICQWPEIFHCRNCLTGRFCEASDDIIRCPGVCGCTVGWKALLPLEQGAHFNYDQEAIEAIRQQPEVMNNLIAYTAEEAQTIFNHVYTMFEDQILDPVALGGIPHHFLEHDDNSLQTGFSCNPFVVCFLDEVTKMPKTMTTPHDLDEDMATLLKNMLSTNLHMKIVDRMFSSDEMMNEDIAVKTAFDAIKLGEIKENWELMIRKWVELVTWRHLERFS
ncbi:uncharacterized protein yc1106_03597 [Curvularia clavata]|uniref:Uncharacterized protein n=1 Tax=Curvularia clavata TaxID=95742 RepID=A0A9Q8Z9K2_CURCL|nr:uncharacterized protein yc1106_03597 [Curvularia clavata]